MSMLAVLWTDSLLERSATYNWSVFGVSLAPKFLRVGSLVGILDVQQKICARLHRVVSRFTRNSCLGDIVD